MATQARGASPSGTLPRRSGKALGKRGDRSTGTLVPNQRHLFSTLNNARHCSNGYFFCGGEGPRPGTTAPLQNTTRAGGLLQPGELPS